MQRLMFDTIVTPQLEERTRHLACSPSSWQAASFSVGADGPAITLRQLVDFFAQKYSCDRCDIKPTVKAAALYYVQAPGEPAKSMGAATIGVPVVTCCSAPGKQDVFVTA